MILLSKVLMLCPQKLMLSNSEKLLQIYHMHLHAHFLIFKCTQMVISIPREFKTSRMRWIESLYFLLSLRIKPKKSNNVENFSNNIDKSSKVFAKIITIE